MRKSFIFLLAIFVCALGSTAGSAQSEPNSQTNQSVSSPSLFLAQAVNAPDGSDTLSASAIAGQISEARHLLSSRQTSGVARDLVTLAAFDPETSQKIIFSLPKNEFLIKNADLLATPEPGRTIRVHVVRANGVNTAVTIVDAATGRALVPLLVQFPIVKAGVVTEMAYY